MFVTFSLPVANSLRNRRPQMMRPTGTHSSYLVLRGQTLDLECIVQGVWVCCECVCVSVFYVEKANALILTTFFSHLLRPTPSIQWVRKDGVLSESRTSKENFNRLLHFNSISERDDGEYQCTANNSQGTITHTYTISVEGMALSGFAFILHLCQDPAVAR